jgi:hypothetical protein
MPPRFVPKAVILVVAIFLVLHQVCCFWDCHLHAAMPMVGKTILVAQMCLYVHQDGEPTFGQ